MSGLPGHWRVQLLDEVAEVRLGRQRSPKNHDGTQMRPYLRAANVGWSGLLLEDVKHMNFTDNEMTVYALHPGDIVLTEASGSPDEVGKPALWSGEMNECAFQNTLIRVRSRWPYPRYLLHYFRWLALSKQFAADARGVGIHHIGRASLARRVIPLPPLSEQRRLVEILEEHLSRLDGAYTGLQGASRRTAALKAAVTTAELDDAEGQDHVLGEICASVRNGIFVSRAKSAPNGVPILRVGAVRPLSLDLSDLRYSERSAEDLAAADGLLAGGDLLFTRYNGNAHYVGACAVVPTGVGHLTYPDKLIRVRLQRNIVDPDFVATALSIGKGREQIKSRVKTTAGQSGISARDLRQVTVRLPSLVRQQVAVRRMRRHLAASDSLAAVIKVASQRTDAIRWALLQSAFLGRLTGRESDLELAEELTRV